MDGTARLQMSQRAGLLNQLMCCGFSRQAVGQFLDASLEALHDSLAGIEPRALSTRSLDDQISVLSGRLDHRLLAGAAGVDEALSYAGVAVVMPDLLRLSLRGPQPAPLSVIGH